MGTYHKTLEMPARQLIIWCIVVFTAIAAPLGYMLSDHITKEPDLTVLICGDVMQVPKNETPRVISIAERINYVDGQYVIWGEGIRQTFSKSDWQYCATLDFADAKELGYIK